MEAREKLVMEFGGKEKGEIISYILYTQSKYFETMQVANFAFLWQLSCLFVGYFQFFHVNFIRLRGICGEKSWKGSLLLKLAKQLGTTFILRNKDKSFYFAKTYCKYVCYLYFFVPMHIRVWTKINYVLCPTREFRAFFFWSPKLDSILSASRYVNQFEWR